MSTETILQVVHDVMSSPWIYLAIFLLAALDAFIPMVPSETVVITAGVFASTGTPSLPLVILAAALGAFAGDHVSYLVGRTFGWRLLRKIKPGTRRRKAFEWAERALAERGGLVLVVARYIPGGRTAITLTMGSVGYPLRRFTFYDTIAAVSWAVYGALVGLIGGAAFENDPIKGVVLGVGLAIGVTVLVEVVRYLLHRRVTKSTFPMKQREEEVVNS